MYSCRSFFEFKYNSFPFRKSSRWHTDREQADALDRQKKVLFGQLGAFAHNMLEFGMEKKETLSFVEKICSINELGKEECASLLGVVNAAAAGRESKSGSENTAALEPTNDAKARENSEGGDQTVAKQETGDLQIKEKKEELDVPAQRCKTPVSDTSGTASAMSNEWTRVTHADTQSVKSVPGSVTASPPDFEISVEDGPDELP